MDTLIVFGAKYLFVVIVLSAASPLLWLPGKSRKGYLVSAILSGGIAFALTKLGGAVCFDPRPFTQGAHALIEHSAENGFPSDHSALSFTAAVLATLSSWRLGLVLIGLATVVAMCRVLAGVHMPIDVVAGALIGGTSAVLGTRASRRLA